MLNENMRKIKEKTSEEECKECGKMHSNKHTFLCSKCYEKDSMFFIPRFELINDKKLLNPDNLERFNNSPYYLKRYFVQILIQKGRMI